MMHGHGNGLSRILPPALLMIAVIGLLFSGCAHGPNTINSRLAGPQVVVNPGAIRLGVATLMGTDIIFEGSGFRPGDSVFISLIEKGETEGGVSSRIMNSDGTYTVVNQAGLVNMGLIVAEGTVNPDGAFTATVGTLAKVNDMLRADLAIVTYSEDAKYQNTLVLTQTPIPAGVYIARATGMLSDQTAETEMTINPPSAIDRLKDWIGKKTGKIIDKRS